MFSGNGGMAVSAVLKPGKATRHRPSGSIERIFAVSYPTDWSAVAEDDISLGLEAVTVGTMVERIEV